MRAKSIILSLLFCLSINVFGQEPTQDFILIILEDGNEYLGTILEETDDFVTIKTKTFPELKIKKSAIKSREIVNSNELHDGEYWYENSNATRNMFGPTGYGLRKGEGYYQNFMLFYNSVSYGFSDNITIGMGLIPISFDEGLFFTITPKLSFPIVEDKFNIGAGLMYTHAYGASSSIAYGVGTYGSRDNNITVGVGYGSVDGQLAKSPILTFSGMFRLSKKFGLVTENWLIPENRHIGEYNANTNTYNVREETRYRWFFTYGARLIFESISVDIGFFNTPEIAEEVTFGIPMAGITVPFGRK